MSYASIGLISLIILIINNFDVLRELSRGIIIPVHAVYRRFLYSVVAYFLVDSLWGLFYDLKITFIAYIITIIYFLIMALSVFLWTRYVIASLGRDTFFQKLLSYIGWGFLIFEIIILVINLFVPIAFWFDEKGEYHASTARYVNFIIQIFMFLITAIHMSMAALKTSGSLRFRHRTIGAFSVGMCVFVLAQAQYPLMPLYSVGYLIGTCLLHAFVLEDEKQEYQRELEYLKEMEQRREKELGSARLMAYTDSLTGVKNKHAYLEAEQIVNHKIGDGTLKDFGIIVLDLNGLKIVNDTKGHEAGDRYIQTACNLICCQFKHSPVYRIGGDEFVVLLEGDDFDNHELLIKDFEMLLESNKVDGNIIVSCGFDKYNPEKHDTFITVFERADKKMYEQKRKIKAIAK